MYIRDVFSSVTRPVKELKGFQRVVLEPGEKRTVTFDITPELLAFYDVHMKYTVEPGDFEIMVRQFLARHRFAKNNPGGPMSEPTVQKLSFFEKAGYSLGDGAANFVFQTMILFQLNFYTDTMGIVAAVAGSLLLVGRLWDAFFDPMMGLMADRTDTRWGKFAPGCCGRRFPGASSWWWRTPRRTSRAVAKSSMRASPTSC